MTYMLDTNICIYVMKNKPEKVLQRFREELDGGLCISSITLAELEYGMKHSSNPAKNEQALLLSLIHILLIAQDGELAQVVLPHGLDGLGVGVQLALVGGQVDQGQLHHDHPLVAGGEVVQELFGLLPLSLIHI